MGLFDFLFGKKKTASESKEPVKKPKSASIRNLHASMSESEVVYSRSDKRLVEYLKGRPNIDRIYSQFTHSIRNGFTVKRFLNEANLMTSDEVKFVVSGSFLDIANILQGILEKNENVEIKKDFNALKEAINILGGITVDQEYWINIINVRVEKMPLNSDATKLTHLGGGVDDLGKMHYEEYKTNEPNVPQNKRNEVALNRIEGFFSIRDLIQNNYSKEHKFHLDASIKGALLYALSLGLNVAEYYDTKLKENNQTLDPSNFKYDENYILNYYDHDGDYFSTEYFSQIETLISKMNNVPEHYKIIQERGIGMHKNFIENNIEVQDQKYWNKVYERHYKSRFDDGSLRVENIKLETNNFELILKEIKKVMEIIEKTKCDFDIQTFCEYYAVKSSLEGLLSFKNNYNDKLFGIKKVEKSGKNKGTQKVYPKSKNHFLEKIDKLEAFSKFSDIQIRNTQITVFKAAVWQLINIDNKITDEENLKFIDFLKEIDNKFLGDDNDKNDPVIGELIQDPDEMIGVLKTFPDDELELFWDTLFSFSMVDCEFSIEEANLIGIIASGVYDNLSNDEIKEWINNKLA
jgi:hypothetical protein